MDGLQVFGAEFTLPVGQSFAVAGDGLLQLPGCQAGAGQVHASGDGGGVAGPVGAFGVGEGTLIVADGAGVLAGGLAGVG